MTPEEINVKTVEYQAAQEMLRHYDSLNWQIGAILIAAVIVLTGFTLNKDIIDLASSSNSTRITILIGFPLLSFFVLGVWLLWFRRHRNMYNYRNEVLHRIELQLGMYHHLLNVEKYSNKGECLKSAKENAGYGEGKYVPFYNPKPVGPSGYTLAKVITLGIPFCQFIIVYKIYCV